MPSSQLILCRPLLLLPPVPPSIKVFSNESALRMTGNVISLQKGFGLPLASSCARVLADTDHLGNQALVFVRLVSIHPAYSYSWNIPLWDSKTAPRGAGVAGLPGPILLGKLWHLIFLPMTHTSVASSTQGPVSQVPLLELAFAWGRKGASRVAQW